MELENKKTELDGEISELGQIYQNKLSEPISFSAGEYTCGVDFQVGRYRIYGGSSNFLVYDRNGYLKVNIILGNDPSWGQVEEYIHYFESGELIESRSSFKMQLIAE